MNSPRKSPVHKAHPWHGVPIGEQAPVIVTTYIEIVPSDTIKYEIDKESGHLKIDRPQQFSNICPTLYGFIPQTYCGPAIASLAEERTGRKEIRGDGDPLDICVLTEKVLPRGDVLLRALPIGGFRLLDKNEADDKIIAVLYGDAVFGEFDDISVVPIAMIQRLKHYFLTYKLTPERKSLCEITHVYGKQEAYEVIERSRQDYTNSFVPDNP